MNHVWPEALPETLARIDLNLLVAFDLLVRERSVTRAAQRMGVTQSAMSHTLRRLRELLGDPLLVRGRGGMTLTPRAEALVIPLRSGLVTLGRALAAPHDFEPKAARRGFRLASIDLFDVIALPLLLEHVRRTAPGVDIAVVPKRDANLAGDLETGEIDLAVIPGGQLEPGGDLPEVSTTGLLRRTLFRDTFSCFIRADHPALAAGPLTLDVFANLSHAMVSPSGSGPGLVDHVLGERGLTRRIALRLLHFYSAPAIIAESDLILTAPTALGALLPQDSPLIMIAPPIDFPEHSIALAWHQRFSDDPGHRWLRKVMVDIVKDLPLAR